MRTTRISGALVLVLCIVASTTFAHHASIGVDRTKTVTVEGTVKEFKWGNPHAWLELNVTKDNKTELWNCRGAMYSLMAIGFVVSWLALYYSISITGLGYQTGYTPWSSWLRGQPVPPRGFAERGAYRFLRHPVYLSFLGLIWFTPRMTLDHALLTVIWTAYIFVGSWLKDRRLTFYLGDKYRTYVAAVPGYPLVPFGPFARGRKISHSGSHT